MRTSTRVFEANTNDSFELTIEIISGFKKPTKLKSTAVFYTSPIYYKNYLPFFFYYGNVPLFTICLNIIQDFFLGKNIKVLILFVGY